MKAKNWIAAAAKAAWVWWDGLPAEDKKKLVKQAEETAKKLRHKD
jgi:hypothetical protein